VDVRTGNGEIFAIKIDGSTHVMRDRRQVDVSELKPGMRVEVEALDDADAKLVAYLVTILPAKE